MEQNIEFENVDIGQNDETPPYTEGYRFLLDEQPPLFSLKEKNPLTALAGGCVGGLLPMLIDHKLDIESDIVAGLFLTGSMYFGYLLTETVNDIKRIQAAKRAEIQNVEMLRNWKRPIYILPFDRFDFTVEKRCIEIKRLLNDAKCQNGLHLSLIEAEKKFSYSIEYGFLNGTKNSAEIGLPVISLFPSLFLLRGANDETQWRAFQNEAVRIANEIDTAFALFFHQNDPTGFKAVAGGQLMG